MSDLYEGYFLCSTYVCTDVSPDAVNKLMTLEDKGYWQD